MIKIECEVEDLSHLIYHSHREAREMGEAKAERDHEIDRRMAAERALENFKAEQAKLPTITPHNEVRTLIQAINRGDKIGAIKSVRVLLGYGLKDAKVQLAKTSSGTAGVPTQVVCNLHERAG